MPPNMNANSNKSRSAGFTLVELMSVTAIIGVLASIALPFMRDYAIQAEVTEGVTMIDELRRRVEVAYYDNNMAGLPTTVPGLPAPNGQLNGGPYWTYQNMFGTTHPMWDKVEYQLKGPNRVLVLRAQRKPEWANSDIGLHLQIRRNADRSLDFRCNVNNDPIRERFVPASCRVGTPDDWVSW